MKKLTKNSRVSLVELPPTQFGEYNGDPGYDIYTQFKMPSRAIPILTAILMNDDWRDVELINPLYHGKNGRLTTENERRIFSSDALLASSIIRTSPQTMELFRRYKSSNPNGISIAGGFDATFRPEKYLEGGADIVVMGEGEKTLSELMKRLTQDQNELSGVRGIAYKGKNSEMIINEERELMTTEELGKMPHPFYDERTRNIVRVATIETSRGCPMKCNFCSVTRFYREKYRIKPIEYVLEELRRIKGMGREIFFVDDNIAGNPKKTIELSERVVSEGLTPKGITAQITAKAARNPELLAALKRMGVKTLCLGIESLNDETLKGLGKRTTAYENMEDIEIFEKEGIYTHDMTVVGGDGDTLKSLWWQEKWLKKHAGSLQIFPLTPTPGTEIYNKMKADGTLLTEDYSLYDGQMVVFRPKNMTPYELQKGIYEMYEDFYSPTAMAKRLLHSPRKTMQLGLFTYLYLMSGKKNLLYSPQALKHLEFLKSVS